MTVPDEVEELIADARLSVHVATSVDDRPHVAPVWYLYDDGVVSFVTSGRKLRNVRQNPRPHSRSRRVRSGSRVDRDDAGYRDGARRPRASRTDPAPDRREVRQRDRHGFQPLVKVEIASSTHTVY
ncbi:MAG: pyridoxamine 5'-phosphate oxidase family protein [Halolamina sp.]